MTGFKLIPPGGEEIRFGFYLDAAPVTSGAFAKLLPFSRIFFHARLSGQEIWIDNMPPLDIIQENASVYTEPGEVVLGPSRPARAKTVNCLGIYYGEGRGLDACNIFARVVETDIKRLMALGDDIWRNGSRELMITSMDT